MKAIIQTNPDDPRALEWRDAPTPEIGDGEVLVKVRAAAVNRADILQARGHYPPPKGVTDILGLECAGVIEKVGDNAGGWQVGDEVCCLLSGGGFAEYAAVPVGQLLPVPKGWELERAVAMPEVACTVYSNIVMVAGLKEGDTLLVHGGAGGILTAVDRGLPMLLLFALESARHHATAMLDRIGLARDLADDDLLETRHLLAERLHTNTSSLTSAHLNPQHGT